MIGVGLQWRTKSSPESDIPNHQLCQTTFEIVDILRTLKSLFSNPDFKSKFFESNRTRHECIEGVYQDYCCGNVNKNNNLFQSQNTVIIQLELDEFDVCCGLKSKAIIHKVFGCLFPTHLFSFRNWIIFIWLHCVKCKSRDIKDPEYCDDDFLNGIAPDLAVLEQDGLDIGENIRIKAGLINAVCDNLGVNFLFGFAGSIAANYYCRFCECRKEETQRLTSGNCLKRRTKTTHDEQIARLEYNPSLNLKETKGVRKYCLFNGSENFHVSTNSTIDIMHDFCEGIIHFFLDEFSQYYIQNKVASQHCSVIFHVCLLFTPNS